MTTTQTHDRTPPDHATQYRPPTHPDVVLTRTGLRAVKVWQPMIRVLHWALVATISVLSLTGWYIADPPAMAPPGWDVMAGARWLHLLTAWVFIGVVVARLVLAFTGNPWARWDQFIPVHRRRRRELWHSVRYYAFLERHPAAVVGHNPLAGLAYVGLFVMLAGEVATGLALMSVQEAAGGWKDQLTGWLARLTTVAVLRLVHHLLMWLIWVFVVVHVYLCVLIDRVEHNGELSSMFGGWKYVEPERMRAELERDADRRRHRYLTGIVGGRRDRRG